MITLKINNKNLLIKIHQNKTNKIIDCQDEGNLVAKWLTDVLAKEKFRNYQFRLVSLKNISRSIKRKLLHQNFCIHSCILHFNTSISTQCGEIEMEISALDKKNRKFLNNIHCQSYKIFR